MSSLARRALRVLARDPAEALDRARNRLEARRERSAPAPALDRAAIRADADGRHRLHVDDAWEQVLHGWLGAPWPCPDRRRFDELWRTIETELRGDRRAGTGLDADPALARAIWCATRHLRPQRVVETGVSRGISSRVILEALALNGSGRLWSIDLPPQAEQWRDLAGSAVPQRLRDRWTFVRGTSRRRLPPLLDELGAVDLFVHDSQHTERNMRFELRAAWSRLRPGGILLCDDAHENRAFSDLVLALAPGAAVAGQEEAKAGLLGIARRPQ